MSKFNDDGEDDDSILAKELTIYLYRKLTKFAIVIR